MRKATLALTAIFAFAGLPARADGWVARADGGSPNAGYAANGAFSGLWLVCSGKGAVRLVVSSGRSAFATGGEQTVVVTIDDTVYLQRMRPVAKAGGADLERTSPLADLAPLADALAKGKKAEIAMPVGRFALPLKGSGRALAAFRQRCG